MGTLNLEFVRFSYSDEQLFDAYRELKFSVFVLEYGWPLLAEHNKTLIDGYDRLATFFACLSNGKMLGVCRCNYADQAYPYKNLLQSQIENAEYTPAEQVVLTSIAFKKSSRGLNARLKQTKPTPAQQLFMTAVSYFKRKNIKRLLLSAQVSGSAKAFVEWGFIPVSEEIVISEVDQKIKNYVFELDNTV